MLALSKCCQCCQWPAVMPTQAPPLTHLTHLHTSRASMPHTQAMPHSHTHTHTHTPYPPLRCAALPYQAITATTTLNDLVSSNQRAVLVFYDQWVTPTGHTVGSKV